MNVNIIFYICMIFILYFSISILDFQIDFLFFFVFWKQFVLYLL